MTHKEVQMEYFILIILAAASLQSAVKLSLLPRGFRYAVPALAVLPLFFMRKHIAALNMRDITAYLNDGNNLVDLCALVVTQELLAMGIGISLLSETELEEKRHPWKYVSLLPSVLMPASALYLQAMAFNHLNNYSFTFLTWSSAAAYAILTIGIAELTAFIRKTRLERIASALNASGLLLMLAVFLPVVATGRISGAQPSAFSFRDLLVLAIALAAVLFITLISYLIKTIMEKRQRS